MLPEDSIETVASRAASLPGRRLRGALARPARGRPRRPDGAHRRPLGHRHRRARTRRARGRYGAGNSAPARPIRRSSVEPSAGRARGDADLSRARRRSTSSSASITCSSSSRCCCSCKAWRAWSATITAFTVAHSLTLAAATLGLVHVPGPPVEAVIALSIVFVAAEIVHGAQRPAGARGAPALAGGLHVRTAARARLRRRAQRDRPARERDPAGALLFQRRRRARDSCSSWARSR